MRLCNITFPKKKSTVGERVQPNQILKWPSQDSGKTSNQQTSSQAGHHPEVRELDSTHTRFGHLYGEDDDSIKKLKHDAWDHLVRLTKENTGQTEGDINWNYEGDGGINWNKKGEDERDGYIWLEYRAAIEEVVARARTKYDKLPNHDDFVNMLREDGCYFLQLALLMIIQPANLGYADDDPFISMTDDRKLIESMFFVGNQIPLVVLKRLMAQSFFKDAVSKVREWTLPPSSLCKKALYELLVLPTHGREGTALHHHSSDILHGLQIMLIGGPSLNIPVSGEHRILLVNNEDENEKDYDSSATSLRLSGIWIKKGSGGIRSIKFSNWFVYGFLYLPVLPVDGTMPVILKNLILYEKHRPLQHAEVSSYIRFMSEIVQTGKDARLLFDKNIVLGDFKDVNKLPKLLKSLASEGCPELTPHLEKVKIQIENFTSTTTLTKGLVNVLLLLTLIQAVFAILQLAFPLKH